MTCIPKRNKKAQRESLLFTISGIVFFALAANLPVAGGIVQLAAIALIVIGLQLLVKFVLTEYRYVIEDNEDGTSDLLIFRRQGKREAKVCHVSIGGVTELCKKDEKLSKTDNRYNYTQNLGADAYSLIFADGEKLIEVIFEPDAAFVSGIEARLGSGGEMRFIM